MRNKGRLDPGSRFHFYSVNRACVCSRIQISHFRHLGGICKEHTKVILIIVLHYVISPLNRPSVANRPCVCSVCKLDQVNMNQVNERLSGFWGGGVGGGLMVSVMDWVEVRS